MHVAATRHDNGGATARVAHRRICAHRADSLATRVGLGLSSCSSAGCSQRKESIMIVTQKPANAKRAQPKRRSKNIALSHSMPMEKHNHAPGNSSSCRSQISLPPAPTYSTFPTHHSTPNASGDASNGPVTGTSVGPSSHDPQVLARQNIEAERLELNFFSTQVLTALRLGDSVSAMTLRLLFARFRRQALALTDPIETLLLNNVLLTHHMAVEMHGRAAAATHVEHIQCFANAAVKLTGCLCQLTTTLGTHRASRRSGDFQPEFKQPKDPQAQ
jgi:hypothetical protein